MDIMNYFMTKARKNIKTIVFPEGKNPSIIEAAIKLKENGLINPVLIGSKYEIESISKGKKELIKEIEIIDPINDKRLPSYTNIYCEERQMPKVVGEKIISQSIYFAGMMVKEGEAYGMVGGIDYPTEEVIMASELILGIKNGISVPSSFYLLDIPGFKGEQESLIVFADPAINPDPTSQELADIAFTTGESVKKLLGWEVKVALLSFSTKGSASHPCVEKIQKTFELLKGRKCDFLFDGELQADAAINKVIGYKKTEGNGGVAGRANVLIFPNLDSCNISSKLVQQFTEAKLYGPILQGFNSPVSDLSRGATVEDIIGSALLTVSR